MPRRSQAGLRRRGELDSAGWDGNPYGIPVLKVYPLGAGINHPGTAELTVTLTLDAKPVVGATITALSDDALVATAVVGGVTNAAGQSIVTVTSVAVGQCNIGIDSVGAALIQAPINVT